jgi:hypothetical protein
MYNGMHNPETKGREMNRREPMFESESDCNEWQEQFIVPSANGSKKTLNERKSKWEFDDNDCVEVVLKMSKFMKMRLHDAAVANNSTLHGTIRYAILKYLGHEQKKMRKSYVK